MIRLALLGVLLCCCVAIGESLATGVAPVSFRENNSSYLKKVQKKKKHYKVKKRKSRKHKSQKRASKKRKLKGKMYSAYKIEKLLQNDNGEKVCNRLNCSSNLQIAKSCLPTKASHHSEKKCFQAFCAYGCNEEDYKTKPEVRDFCNLTCSSKKYLKKAMGNN
jgi:hypothetical protein